jgi:hypothetical protein
VSAEYRSNPIDDLKTALQKLEQKWLSTKEQWNDSNSEDFEIRYIEPIKSRTKITIRTMEELARAISEAKRQVR